MPLRRTSSYSSPVGFQASQRSCFGSCISKPLSKGHSLTVRSRYDHGSLVKSCLDISLRSPKLNVRLLAPCQTRIQWSQRLASAGLFIGLVCCSSSEPVHADAPEAKQHQEASYSHGKIVCNDYSVIGELQALVVFLLKLLNKSSNCRSGWQNLLITGLGNFPKSYFLQLSKIMADLYCIAEIV
mgnify:CR=1 FL=1